MNVNQSNEILQSMINFIKSHGHERVQEIEEQANQAFSIGKEKMIEAEKIKLSAKLELDLMNAEHKHKLERSAVMNKARIIKMQKTAEMVESLKFDAKIKLNQTLTSDKKAYKTLLRDLLIQGLIKMIEPEQMLKVR
jgi:V-type H+-transporting ATPase subunit E